jgi:hypothetical protein
MGNAAYTKHHKYVASWLPAVSISFHEKVALIVEPRAHENLVPVITQMAAMYPDWFIYLFHGRRNAEFARASPELRVLGEAGRLAFLELDVDNLSGLQYNAMFTTREFWELVNATHALVFQTDAWMCEDSTLPLDAFLEYDYVGAPAVNHFLKIKKAGFQNGGFSLRNVDAMKRTIDMCRHVRRKDGEDVFFSTPCSAANSLVAPTAVAQRFVGHQREMDNPGVTPVALHAPWKFYHGLDMDALEMKCGGIAKIKEAYVKK